MTSPPNRCEAATMPSETKDIDDVVTASIYQPAVSKHLKQVIMKGVPTLKQPNFIITTRVMKTGKPDE